MHPEQPIIVLVTTPDEKVAGRIAEAVVLSKLAACCTILPGVRSVYIWEEKMQSAAECQMLIKTRQESYPQLEQAILSLHPYDIPEILAIPVIDSLPSYAQWITESTGDIPPSSKEI